MSEAGLPPPPRRLRIVILGLSITSSWGNGHATTYRSLMRALCRRGHDVLFLERDQPWYRANRDLLHLPFGTTCLYRSVAELERRWRGALQDSDVVILGSYVPDGIAAARHVRALARGVVAFYDIDTPVTMAGLAAGTCAYLTRDLVPAFDLYLSFTGGPVLRALERDYRARLARPLYCAVDPEIHHPEPAEPDWAMGYLGTYSPDRQPTLERLLCEPARRWPEARFAVAGPLYPAELSWPGNVERIEHVGPDHHTAFYARQRFTLNVTRVDMVRSGHSPSVRLFEAAACGVPIISDWWPGLDGFFAPGREIIVARTAGDVLACLRELPENERVALAARARAHVLAQHTAAHRAIDLEGYVEAVLAGRGTDPAARASFARSDAHAGPPAALDGRSR
ncbi:MAG: glycosyltransferase [Alphaproteobacteria bacterium]|nr:glycosyltransferase [Alphaproteobacteria bacterium]